MPTNFPTSLDSLTNPLATDTLNSPSHSGQHADANDAIEALEAKVGVTGSLVTSSLDYRVRNLESTAYFILGDTIPTSPAVGQCWRTTDGSSAVWSGSTWLPVYPLTANTAVLLYEAQLLLDLGLV